MQKTNVSDWRIETMARIRALIKEADPDVVEEQKYKKATNPDGIPVWYHDGMICTGETYKEHLRLTLSKGDLLKEHDPKGIINAHRAIIIHEGDTIDEAALKNLIRAAVELNRQKKK